MGGDTSANTGVLRVHNTLTRRTEPFTPADPARITFYTCGPTVYDDAHIGNFRSFLAADLLRRWIESPLCTLATESGDPHTAPGGRAVVHVMNITDVGHMTDDSSADGSGEDKMAVAGRRLAEAKKAGKLPPNADVDPRDPCAVARFYAERFLDDARRLGLKVAVEAADDPSLMPLASDHVGDADGRTGMTGMIRRLVERGFAYARGEPGAQTVYFDVQKASDYGRLSGNTLDELRGGAGGRVLAENQAEKKHPADFLLWKSDPAHVMKWPSPWGEGYPGWHIECSVMALRRLAGERDEIDIHSGGEDNIFPHHECERAQSCACTGKPEFARLWFHPRFLMVEGSKMSKSAGTFFTARDLFERGHEPAAVRLELIRAHYRSNANFSEQGLKDAGRMVERWRRFLEAADAGPDGSPPDDVRAAFTAAMQDDLNIAGAIGAVNRWIGETDRPGRADAALLRLLDDVIGVLALERPEAAEQGIATFLPGAEPDPGVVRLIEDRAAAKKNRDFAAADGIRDRLQAMGYAIKDVAGGRVEVSRA